MRRPLRAELKQLLDRLAPQIVQDRLRHHRPAACIYPQLAKLKRRVAESPKLLAKHFGRQWKLLSGFQRLVPSALDRLRTIGEPDSQRLADVGRNRRVQSRAIYHRIARERMLQPPPQGGIIRLPDDRPNCDGGEVHIAAAQPDFDSSPAPRV